MDSTRDTRAKRRARGKRDFVRSHFDIDDVWPLGRVRDLCENINQPIVVSNSPNVPRYLPPSLETSNS